MLGHYTALTINRIHSRLMAATISRVYVIYYNVLLLSSIVLNNSCHFTRYFAIMIYLHLHKIKQMREERAYNPNCAGETQKPHGSSKIIPAGENESQRESTTSKYKKKNTCAECFIGYKPHCCHKCQVRRLQPCSP